MRRRQAFALAPVYLINVTTHGKNTHGVVSQTRASTAMRAMPARLFGWSANSGPSDRVGGSPTAGPGR